MMVHVMLYSKLPQAWHEYVALNPSITVVSEEPYVVRLSGANPRNQLPGLVTALGRLGVPARMVRIGNAKHGSAVIQKTS